MEALIWKLPKRRTVLQTERTCTVRVLNLSMIRTGTLSIKAALDILGIPTYHGVTDYIEKPEHQTIWNMAVDAKFYGKGREFGRDEFDCFLGDWAALSDFPTIVFAEDLIQAYPEAKVILVERDFDRWMRSFNEVISFWCTWKAFCLLHIFEPVMSTRPFSLLWKCNKTMWDTSSKEAFQRSARENYHKYYEHIRSKVPKERLLDYELGLGWKPLCDFLGKDIPRKPFPHLNEVKEFQDALDHRVKHEIKRAWKRRIAPALVLSLVAFFSARVLGYK